MDHKKNKILVNVNPEIADDVNVLNDKNTHIVLNEVLTDGQRWGSNQRLITLKTELQEQLEGYKKITTNKLQQTSI